MVAKQLLRDMYLFEAFDDREIDLIEPITAQKTYAPSETIFKEGNEAGKMFFVVAGSISITKAISEKEVARIGKGEIFGEMPFLDGGARSATATAVEQTELIEIAYAKLLTTILNNPETALKFYIDFAKHVSKRLRSTTKILEQIWRQSIHF